jgi:hypothetical protein
MDKPQPPAYPYPNTIFPEKAPVDGYKDIYFSMFGTSLAKIQEQLIKEIDPNNVTVSIEFVSAGVGGSDQIKFSQLVNEDVVKAWQARKDKFLAEQKVINDEKKAQYLIDQQLYEVELAKYNLWMAEEKLKTMLKSN